MNKLKDIILIMLIIFCTASAVTSTVRYQVQRAGTARITIRPLRQREDLQ